MSRLQSLKRFVQQRLTAAVEEIFGHFEKTITEYEEEMSRRHRELLEEVLKPETNLQNAVFPAVVQQLLESKEEVPPEQQERSSSLDQEEPEPPHIKEEQEELWTSQEGEQLQGLEEADITSSPVSVKKSEDDEEKPQSSQLHHRQTDNRDFVGGSELPHLNVYPDSYLQVSNDKATDVSETEVSEDDCRTSEPQSGLNSLGNAEVPVTDVKCKAVKKSFICCECGRKFGRKDSLRRHMRYHTGEKPYSCSVCGKRFSQRPNLIRHMRCHSGEKPFGCSFCNTSFAVRSALVNHMRIHTGEKPYSCLYCGKSFTQKGGLKKHMTVHTGEKPYSCPVCDKSFSQKANLTYHFSVHTGQKQFSCSVCDKRFTWQSQVKSHKCVGESSSSK